MAVVLDFGSIPTENFQKIIRAVIDEYGSWDHCTTWFASHYDAHDGETVHGGFRTMIFTSQEKYVDFYLRWM